MIVFVNYAMLLQAGRLAKIFPLYVFTPWIEDALKAANPDTLQYCNLWVKKKPGELNGACACLTPKTINYGQSQ